MKKKMYSENKCKHFITLIIVSLKFLSTKCFYYLMTIDETFKYNHSILIQTKKQQVHDIFYLKLTFDVDL